ncbi:Acyl-homoserine-lactone synthase [Aliiroseovarius sp. xm-v-201]|uniref:acyl-homoserine-lactone synthase n=1 Tax=unclassified Aliiroseovarius TaxID=2623558 RepID=UPI001568A5E7|nr:MULTISPECIES: acyl-homoserine-lactone synthase [unclassified Aliiroseovarius]NRP48718.1 Acyl-homoserine-lactone synthase [Aliiroseovarius sp. xm-m-354]NRQ03472.1 Acyl-homoserine-lactone synthase [Aliiroseovarius sp. xm-m-309]NRQ06676.1 Acyl-homoserine-lactone synthase [Aliiroseovarius sp. xm-v-201]
MLRYIYANDLSRFPLLRDTMFRDRAEQFSKRLGWDVTVNAAGEERDQYDDLNPLYVIWEMADGRHGGSMRFMPTVGRTMVNEHFSHLTGGVTVESPLIWECTRFCLSPKADRRASAALALGAGELMSAFQLKHYIGVFDPRMQRIYRLMGLEPEVIGSSGEGRDEIGVGLWSMDETAFETTLKRVGVSREMSRGWLRYSLSGKPGPVLTDNVAHSA